MKTNKSYTKRLRVTKKGKIIARKPGQNHFKAKEKRRKQLSGKRAVSLKLTKKTAGRFIRK